MRRTAGVALALGLVAISATAAASPSMGQGPTHPRAQQTRHADAVAEAKRVLRRSPTTSSETRVSTAPLKQLRTAPEIPDIDHLVTRARFWTSDRSFKATYRALSAQVPRGTTLAGSGGEASSKGTVEADVEYRVLHLPATVESAELTVAVVSHGHGHSAVGVYAQVVPRPKRLPDEHVPLSLATVRLAKITLSSNTVTARRTIHGHRAQALVRDFDALTVDPPGSTSCPQDPTAIRATFRAHGHTWRAQYPSCVTVAVTRDGHPLPDLDASRAFSHALKAGLR